VSRQVADKTPKSGYNLRMNDLDEQQIASLKKYVESYKQWLLTAEGKNNLQEHRAHSEFLKTDYQKIA